jgi:threonine/homoserine efflux transporter RhtA
LIGYIFKKVPAAGVSNSRLHISEIILIVSSRQSLERHSEGRMKTSSVEERGADGFRSDDV